MRCTPSIRRTNPARLRDIQVIVLKLGRTVAGAHFALSHTGAIAGDAEVYETMFCHCGVISVRDLNELAAAAILLSCPKRAAPGGLSAVLDSGETVIFFSFKRSRLPRLLFHATILSNS